jgi:uncharacterized membrane protein
MRTSYNRIAGQSVERLAALSDGVFAVAMTLLVLDLRAPFMTLGIFWVGQQTQLNHLTRSDRSLSWMHILFLFAVSMTPFSTMLLAGFIAYRIAWCATTSPRQWPPPSSAESSSDRRSTHSVRCSAW